MYIIFGEDNKEQLRYYLPTLPDDLKQSKYVKIKKEEIPAKIGHMSRARLEGDEIVWEFVEMQEEPTLFELQRENEKLKKGSQMSLSTIIQLDKKVLELEKKINELSK